MPTLTETLDNLYTTTWMNMKSSAADNIFSATPFWFWLKNQGGLERTEGGRFMTEPLIFAKSDNVRFVRKGSTVPLADKEFLTVAKYDWRYLSDSILRFGVDDQQNRGKNQIISLMNAKLENSKNSLIDKMETVLFGSVATDADAFQGLLDIVPDDPTTNNNLGGINNSAGNDTWWRNQATNMNAESFTLLGRKRMTTMLNNCRNNLRSDAPDIIVSAQLAYEMYEEETVEQRQVTNRTLGDAGFTNIEFKGIPMVWSPACTGRMYFLNSRYMKFRYDPQMFFDMTEWKAIPNQINDRVAQTVTAGNLVTGRRRCHGVLYNVTTA
jgi:hypothetical protein